MGNRQVMKEAARLRREGYSASDAMRQAWSEEGGGSGSEPNILVWLAAAYIGWCTIAYFAGGQKSWSWQPWRLPQMGLRRPLLNRPIRASMPNYAVEKQALSYLGKITPLPYNPDASKEQVRILCP